MCPYQQAETTRTISQFLKTTDLKVSAPSYSRLDIGQSFIMAPDYTTETVHAEKVKGGVG